MIVTADAPTHNALAGRHEVAIASSILVDGGVSDVLPVAPADDWLPERSAADGEAHDPAP
jgi:hypothetical protein